MERGVGSGARNVGCVHCRGVCRVCEGSECVGCAETCVCGEGVCVER